MTQSTTNSIASLITVLNNVLGDANRHAILAKDAIAEGNRNGAIGALLPAVEKLDAAVAVLGTIMTLHQTSHALARRDDR